MSIGAGDGSAACGPGLPREAVPGDSPQKHRSGSTGAEAPGACWSWCSFAAPISFGFHWRRVFHGSPGKPFCSGIKVLSFRADRWVRKNLVGVTPFVLEMLESEFSDPGIFP